MKVHGWNILIYIYAQELNFAFVQTTRWTTRFWKE
jgi:hypothetical protein